MTTLNNISGSTTGGEVNVSLFAAGNSEDARPTAADQATSASGNCWSRTDANHGRVSSMPISVSRVWRAYDSSAAKPHRRLQANAIANAG